MKYEERVLAWMSSPSACKV